MNFACNVASQINMNFFLKSDWLNIEIGQNSIKEYLLVLLVILLALLLRRFFATLLSKLLFRIIRKKENSSSIQSFVLLLSKPVGWIITLFVLYICFSSLDVPVEWNLSSSEKPGLLMLIHKVFLISIITSFTFFALRFIDFLAIELMAKEGNGTGFLADKQLLPFLKELVKILMVIIAFFFGLGFVFELNVANLVAGLGLGGLAFALAAKESLENLFASFTIFLDKPFVVGDLVTVNSITGTIEKVGFRSTRIRTLEKSVVSLPNKLLIDNALDNLMLRTYRRADSNLILEYKTSKENFGLFLEKLRNYIEQHPRCNEESMVRFVEFGDNGYVIRLLYFVDAQEFNEFCQIREEINLQILDIAKSCNCSFAFQTHTVLLEDKR